MNRNTHLRVLLRLALILLLLNMPMLAQQHCSCSFNGLRHINKDMNTRVGPPAAFLAKKTATATFQINYNDFTQEAQNAFQYAADIWASLLISDVPITIDASWVGLDENVLGAATPNKYYQLLNSGVSDTWYPVAIANKLVGFDLDSLEVDILAQFSSNFDNWYFGTDGNTPQGRIDFVTVVLHEIGHGLGFVGSMGVTDGQGSWGAGSASPFIFDRFAENGSGQSLINLNLFPSPSTLLANQLTSGNIFWNGVEAQSINGGVKPELYAPSNWSEGSSYAHLDENRYPAGNINSLMTPSVGNSEAIHTPGPIIFGVFRDIGWGINSDNTIPYLSVFQNPALNGILHFAVNVENFSSGNVSLTANDTNIPLNANGENSWYGTAELTRSGDVALRLTAGTAQITRTFSVASLSKNGGSGESYDRRFSIEFSANSVAQDYFLPIFDHQSNPNTSTGSYSVGLPSLTLRQPATVIFEHSAEDKSVYYNDNGKWQPLPTRYQDGKILAETRKIGEFKLGPRLTIIDGSRLLGNYPNPFNPETHIRFQIGRADHLQNVKLAVFNIRGQLQQELLNSPLANGEYQFTWNGQNANGNRAASGIYIYQLQVGGNVYSGKMILVR